MFIDDLDGRFNASIKRSIDGRFTIKFTAGLICELWSFARDITYGSDKIFLKDNSKIESREILSRAHIWLFFIWLEYIFQHEFAHAHSGHIELISSDSKWNEFGINSSQIHELTYIDRWSLEAQADRWASANIWTQIVKHHKFVGRDLYGVGQTEALVTDYVIGILHLYELLDLKSGGSTSPTHPPAFFRTFIFQHFFIHTAKRLEELLKSKSIDTKHIEDLLNIDVESITHKAYLRFFGHLDSESLVAEVKNAQDFVGLVPTRLKALGLSPN